MLTLIARVADGLILATSIEGSDEVLFIISFYMNSQLLIIYPEF